MDWGILMAAVALGAMLVLALAATGGRQERASSTTGIGSSLVGLGEPWMRKIIHVSGLPASFTEERLTALFVAHGTVDIIWLVRSRISGQSEGYGFVMMGTREQAQDALSTLHGTLVEGTLLRCAMCMSLPPLATQSAEPWAGLEPRPR